MGGYLPCHVLVLDSGGVGEIWCALSGRAADGTHVRDRLRGILFAAMESRFPDAVFEVRGTHQRVRLADGRWSGWARVSAGGLAGDALDVFGWDTEKVGGDDGVAAGEHQAGTLDALVDGVGVARGVFCDGAVDDLGLGGVGLSRPPAVMAGYVAARCAGATCSSALTAPACRRLSQTAMTRSGSARARALARCTASAPRRAKVRARSPAWRSRLR